MKVDITNYKNVLRKSGISHEQLAQYTGFTRETVTWWFLGKKLPPRRAAFIIESIKRIIADPSIARKKLSVKK